MTNIKTDLEKLYMESNDLNYYPNMDVIRPSLKKELDNFYKNKSYSDLELAFRYALKHLKINN